MSAEAISTFKPGDQVTHLNFGPCTVIEYLIPEDSDGDEMIMVRFPNGIQDEVLCSSLTNLPKASGPRP